jgi:small-conductance mechanosensitive channel
MSEFDGVVDGGGVPDGGVEPQPQPNPLEPGGARFEQVYGKMKEYERQIQQFKDLGDAGGVKTQLEKLKTYEKAIEDYRKQAAMTPDEKTQAERQLAIQKELYKVMPNLKNLDRLEALEAKLAEYETKATETQTDAILEKMSAKFSETLKAAKIDPKYQGKIEDYIVSQMNKEELQDFVKGNYEIAERITTTELKDGVLANLRRAPGLPQPPVRNTPGGTPPKGQERSKTMKEAEDEAWARLTGDV